MIWVRRIMPRKKHVCLTFRSLAAHIMVLWKELEPFYTDPPDAKAQQDRQCTYKVTQRRVRVTTVTV